MTQENEHIRILIAARGREIEQRRNAAKTLAQQYVRGDTERHRGKIRHAAGKYQKHHALGRKEDERPGLEEGLLELVAKNPLGCWMPFQTGRSGLVIPHQWGTCSKSAAYNSLKR